MSVKYIPEGYHTATPYIIVKDAVSALAFYQSAFGATERGRLCLPDDTIMHGEMTIGDSIIMFAEENPEMGMLGPKTLNGSPVSMCIYVEDVDAVLQQALDAGATIQRPAEDQFWGDRAATILDPFGHSWTLMTHIEELEWEEIQRRFNELYVSGS